jgi:hypothetical protein
VGRVVHTGKNPVRNHRVIVRRRLRRISECAGASALERTRGGHLKLVAANSGKESTMYRHRVRQGLLGIALFFLSCTVAAAQTISGMVTDPSGAVLPGVTVETTNTATRQVRTVTTDEAGRYVVANLQPGNYSVAYTLSGFAPVTRAGITLTSDFTAAIDMQLTLGGQTDTITVTADAPLVDIRSSAAPQTIDRETMDILPTGSRSAEAIGVLIPGVTLRAAGNGTISRDVGGSSMMNTSPLQFRGTNDTVQVIQGMRRVYLRPGPEFTGIRVNDGAVQEMTFGQGAEALDMGQSGMRINVVPKSGGNVLHGTMFGTYTGEAFQSKMNIDEELTSLGFTNPTGVIKLWDLNPSVNGPVQKDRLWFALAYRHWGVTNTAPITINESTDGHSYKPGTTSATDPGHIWDVTGRLTWQASGKDNIATFLEAQKPTRERFRIAATVSPEAAGINTFPAQTYNVRWTRVESGSLLFDVGYQHYNMENQVVHVDQSMTRDWCYDNIMTPHTTPAPFYTITEQSTGILYNLSNNCRNDHTKNNHVLGTATYIQGAHEWRSGVSFFNAESYNPQLVAGYASVRYSGVTATQPVSVPNQVTLQLPRAQTDIVKGDIGLWVQDRWRLNRLTLNYGVRLDMLRTGWPEETLPPNPFGVNLTVAAEDSFVNWKDVSPRVGAAYDLFGTGRTALKGSVGRYVEATGIALTAQGNPMSALAATTNRTWTDNGDFTPFNPDFTLQTADVFGPSSNANFGQASRDTTVDEELRSGWGKRPATYEADFGVQHQIGGNASVTAIGYHRWNTNMIATENVALSRSQFSGPFCVTAPTTTTSAKASLLPDGGGYPVCGLYDVVPAANGLVSNLVTSAKNVGDVTLTNTGFTMSADVRLANVRLSGGFDMRNDRQDTCGILAGDHPAALGIGGAPTYDSSTFADGSKFCETETGYRPDVKFSGAYELPWGIMTSATFQNAAGPPITGTWAAPNSVIAAPGALGRNLAACPATGNCTATKTINLIQPQTEFGDRLNQIDLRVSKRFALRQGARFAINADLYNVTNTNWIIAYGTTFGPNFLRPSQVLSPRMFKIGGQFDF